MSKPEQVCNNENSKTYKEEFIDTIYQCCKQGKDVNKTPHKVHCEPTEALAIKWLEKNGGGIYKNVLHNFQFYVAPKL